MERNKQPGARYGVEIKGVSHHAEADNLAHIGTLLNGHKGRVLVFDWQNRSLLFEGTVDDFHNSLDTIATPKEDSMRASSAET